MADIGISVSNDIKTNSVFINPKIKPRDGYTVLKDKDGNITGIKEEKVTNVISKGNSRIQAIRQAYGTKLSNKHKRS